MLSNYAAQESSCQAQQSPDRHDESPPVIRRKMAQVDMFEASFHLAH